MRGFLLVAALVLVIVLASTSVFTVDRSELVYVTFLGRHTATYDGKTDAGLHCRWPAPIQGVIRLDRRLQVFDLPATEQLTRDAGGQTIDRTLMVEGFVCWRIAGADGVDRFIRTVGTPDRARTILSQQISSQLSAEIGKMRLDQFVSYKPGQVDEAIGDLRQRLLRRFQKRSQADYGINIVDIRLRRYNYPSEVRPDIAQRIISERNKKKAEYESEARVRVGQIEADSQREVQRIRAEAQAEATRRKGQADAEADLIRNEAFSKDPDFYVFLKKLEEYGKILGNNRTVLLLSSHRELFDLLFAPPKLKSSRVRPGNPSAGLKQPVGSSKVGGQ